MKYAKLHIQSIGEYALNRGTFPGKCKWQIRAGRDGEGEEERERYYKHPYVNLATIWPVVAITDIPAEDCVA